MGSIFAHGFPWYEYEHLGTRKCTATGSQTQRLSSELNPWRPINVIHDRIEIQSEVDRSLCDRARRSICAGLSKHSRTLALTVKTDSAIVVVEWMLRKRYGKAGHAVLNVSASFRIRLRRNLH
jgi:hypothetical protein